MLIGVIGVGMVGGAVLNAFKQTFDVVGYDVKGDLALKENLARIYADSSIVFVCVNTPTVVGIQDTSQLHEALAGLSEAGYKGVVVIKSTILPGTSEYLRKRFMLRIVHNPEFLTARNACEDFLNQGEVLISGAKNDTAEVAAVYSLALPQSEPKTFPDYKVTEITKYMRNVYLAMKVAYANEIFDLCKSEMVDYDTVLQAMLGQGGIEPAHFYVPGPDGKRGYSGACFPKDVRALVTHMRTNRTRSYVIQAVELSNQVVRPHDAFCKETGE